MCHTLGNEHLRHDITACSCDEADIYRKWNPAVIPVVVKCRYVSYAGRQISVAI